MLPKTYLSTLSMMLLSFMLQAQQHHLSHEMIWATRTDDTTYVIETGSEKALKVYAGLSEKKMDWKKSRTIKKGTQLQYRSARDQRMFFATIQNKDTLYFTERRLPLKGTSNFRDIGGIETREGRTVLWNRVFRCGEMHQLTSTDLDLIRQLNIATVVDFRNDDELARSTDKYPEGQNIKAVRAHIGANMDKSDMGMFFKMMMDPNATAAQADSVFMGYYVKKATMLADFRPLFEELLALDENHALVMHCTAGKDRTGVAVALLLYVLGVPEPTIYEEYALSDQYTREGLKDHPQLSKMNPVVVNVIAGVRKEYIEATFSEVKKIYGSIDNALEKELGIDEASRRRLVQLYTR